jgi:hypothetical protein
MANKSFSFGPAHCDLGCWRLALAAVAASTVRIEQFKDFYRMYEQKTRNTDGSTDTYPPFKTDQSLVHRLTNVSLLGLPTLFIFLWIAVLVLQVTRGE